MVSYRVWLDHTSTQHPAEVAFYSITDDLAGPLVTSQTTHKIRPAASLSRSATTSRNKVLRGAGERNLAQCHFVYYTSHTAWPGIERETPGCQTGDKPPESRHIEIILRLQSITYVNIQFIPHRKHFSATRIMFITLTAVLCKGYGICLDFFNPLNTKGRLLYLKTQFVPRSKHFSSRL